MMDCEHLEFEAHVDINRITDDADKHVLYLSVELNIKCKECHKAMLFNGMPMGLSPYHPATDVDGVTARLPMEIPERSVPQNLAGFSVKRTT